MSYHWTFRDSATLVLGVAVFIGGILMSAMNAHGDIVVRQIFRDIPQGFYLSCMAPTIECRCYESEGGVSKLFAEGELDTSDLQVNFCPNENASVIPNDVPHFNGRCRSFCFRWRLDNCKPFYFTDEVKPLGCGFDWYPRVHEVNYVAPGGCKPAPGDCQSEPGGLWVESRPVWIPASLKK